MRGRGDGRRGGGPPPDAAGTGGAGLDRGDRPRGTPPVPPPPPQAPLPTPGVPPVPGIAAPDAPTPPAPADAGRGTATDRPSGRRRDDGSRGGPPSDRSFRGAPPDTTGRAAGPNPPPGGDAPVTADADRDRITFDMMPIRREMIQQLVGSPEDWQKLSPEERQRVIGEVNQRMLGIVQGIQMSAAEMQKKVSEAQRAADARAREVALAAAARRRTASRAAQTGAPAAAPGPAPAARAAASAAAAATTTAATDTAPDPPPHGVHRQPARRRGRARRQGRPRRPTPRSICRTCSPRSSRRRAAIAARCRSPSRKDGQLYTPTDGRSDEDRVAWRRGDVGRHAAGHDRPAGLDRRDDGRSVRLRAQVRHRAAGRRFARTSCAGPARATPALGLGFIALALVGIVPLSARLTRNLSRSSDGVHRIAQGDYRARVPVASKDEIGQLATAFNQMAADVEQHQHARRRAGAHPARARARPPDPARHAAAGAAASRADRDEGRVGAGARSRRRLLQLLRARRRRRSRCSSATSRARASAPRC